jgi:hypothetical protein
MARRPGGDDPFTLSPRTRWIIGWVAAVLLIGGIALAVRILGDSGDGAVASSHPVGSQGASAPTVTFGTALDSATGQVAAAARSERFADGDPFVYSVPPSGDVPPVVFVEVRRTGGGVAETVQPPIEGQRLPNPEVIAFSVPAAALLADFGPGEYLMLIYTEPDGEPIAQGTFVLVGATASPPASP